MGQSLTNGVRGRAFIIEDDVLIAMDLEEMLREFGFEHVVTASTMDDVRQADADGYHVVIADLQIGQHRSTPLLQHFASKGVPIIIATGADDAAQIVQSLPGSAAWLEKPYTNQGLEDALAKVGVV